MIEETIPMSGSVYWWDERVEIVLAEDYLCNVCGEFNAPNKTIRVWEYVVRFKDGRTVGVAGHVLFTKPFPCPWQIT